jgi:hypothetical protein
MQGKNIYNWATTSPISLVFLRYDSVVPNISSLEACGEEQGVPGLKSLSEASLVNCIKIDNTKLHTNPLSFLHIYLDHPEAEEFLQLVALHEIESST